MNGSPELDHFLRTDPRDAGCAQATEILYVLRIPRIVLGFIGWQTCGRHPARRQSWPGPGSR
jgi:hypothetical protein